MTGWGLNLGSSLNSSARPTGFKSFICSEIPEQTVKSLISFRSVQPRNWGQLWNDTNPHPSDWVDSWLTRKTLRPAPPPPPSPPHNTHPSHFPAVSLPLTNEQAGCAPHQRTNVTSEWPTDAGKLSRQRRRVGEATLSYLVIHLQKYKPTRKSFPLTNNTHIHTHTHLSPQPLGVCCNPNSLFGF